jgi:tRNA A37 threonylcarbamoyladenosine synthetase subunit TsaC/SUA5/YrdC
MLKDLVFLTQTDTTIGFVSQNANRLTHLKQRPPHKYYIKAVNSLHTLKKFTRIPSSHKNRVRRSNKTTFILPNGYSYRIINDPHHLLLLNRLTWAYTTSANLSNIPYDAIFAKEAADVIITPLKNTQEASGILKINKKSIKKVR